MSGKENNMSDRNEIVSRVTAALEGKPAPVAIRNARKVDARGERRGYWVVSDAAGVIVAAGTGEGAFEHCCRTVGLDPADRNAVIDAEGRILTPGYVDIHAHGAWEKSFDDGPDGIDVARAGHAVHGTTRQVLSLITNPVDVICRNIRTVRATMESGRPDILGCHLEGPFLALARKGAHDPECLKDPVPDIVDKMLEASGADPASGKLGCIRQITIAPELPHGISAIRQFAAAGVVPAVGHCDADYETAKAGFDAGAGHAVQRLVVRQQIVEIITVAFGTGDTARAGVGLLQQTQLCQHRHLVAQRRAGNRHVKVVCQHTAAHGLTFETIQRHDRLQDSLLACIHRHSACLLFGFRFFSTPSS